MKNVQDRIYVENTYRVLMTRARQGMIIWIPPGDPTDPTRPASGYEGTAAFKSANCNNID